MKNIIKWRVNEMDGRAWIECTKWSGNKSNLLVNKAADLLCTHGHNMELDETRISGLGSAKLLPDGSLQYSVGIREIFKNPRRLFSIHEALAPTVACFHEVCGHGGQWRNEAKKDEPLSKVLLLNDLACKSSSQFYGVNWSNGEPTPQYFEQPHEIAAQYMGLKMTQKFLSAVYDEETADKLLCEYVNLRIASGNEFIKAPDDYHMEIPIDGRRPYMKPTEPFTSMSQVYGQFQKTFVRQAFAPANYTVTRDSMDFVGNYVNNQKWPWERAQSRHQVNRISDRLTQAYVLSAVWLEQHEYGSWIRKLPVFEHMDFPECISRLAENAPNHPDETALDLKLLTEDDLDFARAVDWMSLDTGQAL